MKKFFSTMATIAAALTAIASELKKKNELMSKGTAVITQDDNNTTKRHRRHRSKHIYCAECQDNGKHYYVSTLRELSVKIKLSGGGTLSRALQGSKVVKSRSTGLSYIVYRKNNKL